MFKINFHFVIYRYELLVALIILILTGSVSISLPDRPPASYQRYPYTIALTFDDGPHLHYTDRLISILRENGACATFFVVGGQVVRYPFLVKALALAGNEVSVHTFTHRNLERLDPAEVLQELDDTRRCISDITGVVPNLYRPPGGRYNADVIRAGSSLDLTMALWTVFPKDHEEESATAIVRKVLEQANDRGVVLLHSGREPTLEALPVIIRDLRARGYRFVTVSELARTAGAIQPAWLKK